MAELHQPQIGQHSQDMSSSVILDHGSISFGRFAAESLAWEKWSVFRHNRCQEELEMYKSNGLVAQKKAYFEEYYKRVRALKALQSEHQETAHVGACADVGVNSVQLENGNDMSKEGRSADDTVDDAGQANKESLNDCADVRVNSVQLEYNDMSKEERSENDIVDEAAQASKESLNDCDGYSDNFTVRDEAGNALSDVDREQSSRQASVSATPLVAGSSGVTKHDSHVSAPVKLNANEKKKLAPVSKAKGGVALARNKSKLDCTSTKDAVKASTKSKPLQLNQITGRDDILLPRKSNTMAASGKNSGQVSSRKKLTEVRSSAAVLHPSARIKMVPSSPSGRSDQRNTNTNGKDLTDSLQRSQPVHARAFQNPLREKPISSGLKNKELEKRTCPGVSRKPSELSSQQMRPKVCQSENQRPNSILPNIARNRLNRDTEVSRGHKIYGKQRKEKEGGEGFNSTFRRDTRSSCNLSSSIQKNLKTVHKGKEEISRIRRRDSKPVSTVASVTEKNSKPCYKTTESCSGSLKHTFKGTKV